MKKKIITLIAVATLTLAMTACGTAQTSNTPTSTPEPTKEVEATTAPTVEPTATNAPEATATPEPTATSMPEPTATSTPTPEPTATPEPTSTPVPTSTPTPAPYAVEKGIIIENKTEFDSSFVHYVRGWESEEETVFPGLTTKNEECRVVVDSVTQKKADEEGYTTFTVKYHLNLAVKQSVDIREGDTCGRIVWLTPAFSICDYYTGISGINKLVEGGIGDAETVLNWQGEEIKVHVSLQEEFGWDLGEWNQESEHIYSMQCPALLEHTVAITVPDGYDGIMLSMSKKGLVGQGKADVDEILKNNSEIGEMFSEGETTEEYYFIRLTDIAEKITDVGPTEEPTVTPVPTEAPKSTEAPVADTAEWETVLRELHSLETYEEREAYIAGLDASKYEVASTEDFDLINKKNSYEGLIPVRDEDGFSVYDDNTGESVKTTGTVYARLDLYTKRLCETQCDYWDIGPVYLMTVKNIATGETDPWGVMNNTSTWDGRDRQTYTIELIITRYSNELENFINGTSWFDDAIFACASYYEADPAPIKTWGTLKYYEDLTK